MQRYRILPGTARAGEGAGHHTEPPIWILTSGKLYLVVSCSTRFPGRSTAQKSRPSLSVIDDVSVDLQVLPAQIELDRGTGLVGADEAGRVAVDLERLQVEAVVAADEGDVPLRRVGAAGPFEIGELAVTERIVAAVHRVTLNARNHARTAVPGAARDQLPLALQFRHEFGVRIRGGAYRRDPPA